MTWTKRDLDDPTRFQRQYVSLLLHESGVKCIEINQMHYTGLRKTCNFTNDLKHT